MIEADPIGCRAAGRYGTVDHLLGARCPGRGRDREVSHLVAAGVIDTLRARPIDGEEVMAKEFSHLDGPLRQFIEAQAAIVVAVDRIADSCGYSVPYYEFVDERPVLDAHHARQPDEKYARRITGDKGPASTDYRRWTSTTRCPPRCGADPGGAFPAVTRSSEPRGPAPSRSAPSAETTSGVRSRR